MKYAKKLIFIAILIVIAASGWLYYAGKFGSHPQFIKSAFNDIPGWNADNQNKALEAFKHSCTALLKLNPESTFHNKTPQYGKVKDWQAICIAANQIKKVTPKNAREFFETWFEPYHVKNSFNANGLFTGYYLPLLQGNLKRSKQYNVPIYGLPDDLAKINLHIFNPALGNQTLIGQLKKHVLYPYPDRAAIIQGKLGKKAPVLAWGNNAINVFFAQIQGSAIVQLPHHKQIMIGYASGNGHPYTAIGKVLVQNHALKKSEVSMQTIYAWLTAHPDQANDVLNKNANYIFFRLLKTKEPLGSQQVPLTPQRTLAVDTRYIALGTPIWLDTTAPENSSKQAPFQHLLIAQDTGGAIKGVVRGDVYWGAGEKAAYTAGHMANAGEYWVLLPKKIQS